MRRRLRSRYGSVLRCLRCVARSSLSVLHCRRRRCGMRRGLVSRLSERFCALRERRRSTDEMFTSLMLTLQLVTAFDMPTFVVATMLETRTPLLLEARMWMMMRMTVRIVGKISGLPWTRLSVTRLSSISTVARHLLHLLHLLRYRTLLSILHRHRSLLIETGMRTVMGMMRVMRVMTSMLFEDVMNRIPTRMN